MIDLYTYLDYRKFLKDFLDVKQQENSSFSYRHLAREAGTDSGYITKILKEKRHISLSLAQKFCDALKLDGRQSDYFQILVLFAKSKTHSEKSRYYERLLTFKTSPAAVLSEKQYALFDQWYYLAVREMVACFEFVGDYSDLGKRLSPPISQAKARKAVNVLVKLGLVRKRDNGVYERIEPVWTVNRDIESVSVNRLQIGMMNLAKEAYDRFPRTQRDMSTLTLSVSKDEYNKMTEELSAMRSRFLAMAKNSDAPDRVYHLNLSLFPLSKPLREKPL